MALVRVGAEKYFPMKEKSRFSVTWSHVMMANAWFSYMSLTIEYQISNIIYIKHLFVIKQLDKKVMKAVVGKVISKEDRKKEETWYLK